MSVESIVEERYHEDDLAVVVPDRHALFCKFPAGDVWNFAFAGFETKWNRPLELEVTGSGGYAAQDEFSIAALSIDYGDKTGGWSERHLFGMGLIQPSRGGHPPGWGVGGDKNVMRGNLLNASPQSQHLKIDLPTDAPKDWDGRVWIGLLLHNVGADKWLKVRIVNAGDAATISTTSPAEEFSPDQQLHLMHDHNVAFLQHALADYEKDPDQNMPADAVAPEMKPFVKTGVEQSAGVGRGIAVRRALGRKEPPNAETFLQLAENYFAWQREKAIDPHPGERFNAILKTWHDGGDFGKEIGCIIRTASNLEKIGLADVESGRVLGKSDELIRFSAARNEYEAFQIIFTPMPGCAANVAVSLSDFTGPNGATIPASNIQTNPVGYVRIFPGEPRERLCPDPLLLTDIPPLAAGENQPVWITTHVPMDAVPGIYHATAMIGVKDSDVKLAVPVELKVRSFEIPKQISMQSSFWMFRDQFNRYYHQKDISIDDYLKWIDFALAHRINPIDVFEADCDQLLDIIQNPPRDIKTQTHGLPNPHPDFTNWDRYLDHLVAGGASSINLGMSHHFGGFFSDDKNPVSSPEQINRVEQAIRILEDHYKAKGLMDRTYLQLRDETSAPDSLNVYRAVHKDFPELKLLLTAPSGDAWPILDAPCPLSPGFNADYRDQIHARHGVYWWYVCLAPQDPWANLFIFQSGSQHRALFWQTWSHHVDGILYWGLNFWSGYGSTWPADVKPQTTRIPAAGAQVVGSIAPYPGDGFSIYPGPDSATPMSSIRLESIRDGEEDYEYFLQLDRAIAKADAAGIKSASLDQAKAARDDATKLVENMTAYNKTAGPYAAIRERVGDAIEQLTQ